MVNKFSCSEHLWPDNYFEKPVCILESVINSLNESLRSLSFPCLTPSDGLLSNLESIQTLYLVLKLTHSDPCLPAFVASFSIFSPLPLLLFLEQRVFSLTILSARLLFPLHLTGPLLHTSRLCCSKL